MNILTEKQYRALERDSYSSLSTFVKNRKTYYKKYVMGMEDEDEDDEDPKGQKAVLTGTLVHTILLEGEEEFDNKFYMSIREKDPTPNVVKFVNKLYKITLDNTNEDGVVEKEFDEMAKEAYIEAGIKKPLFPRFIEDFIKDGGLDYYKEVRETRPMSKKIVTIQDRDNSNRVVEELRNNPHTSFIFTQRNNSRYSVFNELQCDTVVIYGYELKCMLDKIIVDHEAKTIQPYDLKCTWNVEEFHYSYYLKNITYLQAVIYFEALYNKFVDLGFDYSDYEIKFPIFVVVDSYNYMKPLQYQLEMSDLREATFGFKYGEKWFPGLKEVIEDLRWAKENNEWRISRKNSFKGGIISLKKGV